MINNDDKHIKIELTDMDATGNSEFMNLKMLIIEF